MEIGHFLAYFCVILILILCLISLLSGSKGTANNFFIIDVLTALGGGLMAICTALLGK